ncbi:hypothetical protein IM40_09445 (plasmid) [Candidatus Paracaedimonas acanthamoebae]|nr:hypothetical protein IM40_09445 [Candidatus Paracaedimonas acanthamoebae]
MKIFKTFIIAYCLCLSISIKTQASSSILEDECVVRVHPVGQGNCVTVEFQDEVMIVDLGTTSIKNESIIREALVREATLSLAAKKPKKKPSKPKSSIESPSELLAKLKESESTKIPSKTFKEECIRDISEILFKGPAASQKIKTVLLTHGDIDHTNCLIDLVRRHKYTIENLVLGGMPEEYALDEEWLNYQLNCKGFKLYIPALSFGALDLNLWEEVLSLSKQLQAENKLAPQAYSFPISHLQTPSPQDNLGHSFEELEAAFSFRQAFKIYLLSVNPTHFSGAPLTLESSQTSTFRITDDPNTDSLVLKIVNIPTGFSIMLTGDATGQTNKRIYDNYRRFLHTKTLKNFLKTDVYLAAHHGSATHESNHPEWIHTIVRPRIVFISNGRSQGHPYKQAYTTFRNSPRIIKDTPRHNVDYALKEQEKANYKTKETNKAIFSTLNSGLLTARFHTERGILVTAGNSIEGSPLEFTITPRAASKGDEIG